MHTYLYSPVQPFIAMQIAVSQAALWPQSPLAGQWSLHRGFRREEQQSRSNEVSLVKA